MMRRIIAVTALVIGIVITAAPAASGAPAPAALPSCGEARLLDFGNRVSAHVPVVSGTNDYKCILTQGHHNWGVVVLQISLKECEGQTGLDVDGIYGPDTAAAVTKVQHKYRIAEDGVYGPQTFSRMLWRGSFPGATGPVPICARY